MARTGAAGRGRGRFWTHARVWIGRSGRRFTAVSRHQRKGRQPMQSSHGTPTAGTQQSLPGTEHVLAELGSIYPTVAYWASEEAAEEEELSPPDPEQQAEELDEVIFAGFVAMR